jgi:hypothetical protein
MIAPVRTAKPLSKRVRKSGVQIVYTSFYSTFTEAELFMIQGKPQHRVNQAMSFEAFTPTGSKRSSRSLKPLQPLSLPPPRGGEDQEGGLNES